MNEFHRDPDKLRRILHHGDPANDPDQPTQEEIAAMRRTVLTAFDEGPRTRHSWLPDRALFAAALLALLLGAGFFLKTPSTSPPSESPNSQSVHLAVEPTTVNTPPPRVIHFETPGGNRIVWLLLPNEITSRTPSDGSGGVS